MLNNKVSIIIPAYNCEDYIAETLDSVLAQTYQDWECIVVNDGSTDNTLSIVKKYASTDNRIKSLSQENQGPSVARNNAIAHSSGEYILPLDADDLIEPTYIEEAVSVFVSIPETKLVYCRADYFGTRKGEWILPQYDYNDLIWENSIFCTAMFRRTDYENTDGYNPNMIYGLEDWDFWLKLLRPEDKVIQINSILFHYRIKTDSRNATLSNQLKEMYNQIYHNHPNLYAPYCSEILINKHLMLEREEEIVSLKKELHSIRLSKAYRLGKFLLMPFRRK